MTTDVLARLESVRDEYALKCCAGDTVNANTKVAEVALNLKREIGVGSLSNIAHHPELAKTVLDKMRQLIMDRVRTVITFTPGCSLFTLDPLIHALNTYGHELGLYVFAGQIVEATQTQAADRFIALNEDAFAARLGAQIAFGKEANGDTKRVPCPSDLRRAIFGQTHRLGAIEIKRVATTPVWRAGKLYANQGFDPGENIWIDAPVVSLPAVCDKAAAIAALKFLRNELREFAFADELSRSAAIAALLSAATRASFRAPAILITKTDHGQGASLLTDLINILLTGSTAPGINASKSQVEIDKEVDSTCLKGGVSIILDNISAGSTFNSISLAQTITAETRQVRILGVSNAPNIECTQLVIANGVNVQIAADLARRFIACKLDPRMENPSEREFTRSGDALKEEVKRDRSRWLAAAYTIITAYYNSGDRVRVRPLAGFEAWCSTVSAALVWLGCEDVIASQAIIRAEDPATADLHALAAVWLELFGEQAVTVQQLHNGTCDYDSPGAAAKEHAAARDLLTELLARITAGRDPSTALGNWLRRYKGRVVGTHQLFNAGTGHGGGAKWKWARIATQDEEAHAIPTVKGADEIAPVKERSGRAISHTPAVCGRAVATSTECTPASQQNGCVVVDSAVRALIEELGPNPRGKPLGRASATELVNGFFGSAQDIASADPESIIALNPTKFTAEVVSGLKAWARQALTKGGSRAA